MTTITEDYVSFEIAKLLKEKGFDEDCWCWYEEDGYLRESNDDFGVQSNSDHVVDDDEYNCSAPTIQMAMKWLREVHNLHIDIDPSEGDWNPTVLELEDWSCVVKPEDEIPIQDSYEQACEAAIKYCLENLI